MKLLFYCTWFFFTVIDDEASTVYTAGAIVTVTVTLFRQNMSVLFGDETVKEKYCDDVREKNAENGDQENEDESKEETPLKNAVKVF